MRISRTRMVIADSSTLIHLAAIDRLELLRDFYGAVIVPEAVWRESVLQGAGRPGVDRIEAARHQGWIEVTEITERPLRLSLTQRLDEGEAEVITLAIERGASLVLLDESEARWVAGLFGLPKTGVIGILIRARTEGRIPSLRAELDNLRNRAGFWIEQKLYRKALSAVGEAPSPQS
jgi:predicted nucleic acid-binding protein